MNENVDRTDLLIDPREYDFPYDPRETIRKHLRGYIYGDSHKGQLWQIIDWIIMHDEVTSTGIGKIIEEVGFTMYRFRDEQELDDLLERLMSPPNEYWLPIFKALGFSNIKIERGTARMVARTGEHKTIFVIGEIPCFYISGKLNGVMIERMLMQTDVSASVLADSLSRNNDDRERMGYSPITDPRNAMDFTKWKWVKPLKA